MANLGCKDGIYHVRFRFRGREYKRSLKVRKKDDAEAAKRSVEQTIHRLHIGLIELPPRVDPADFILGGGTRTGPTSSQRGRAPSTRSLTEQYLEAQKHALAPSYHYLQGVHLRHLLRHLGHRADASCDRVVQADLVRFLQERLATRDAVTVSKERTTLVQFYKWVVRQQYLTVSPASEVPVIKGGTDRPPFRTVAEIERIIERGGVSEGEILDLWERLYLTPEEIAELLAAMRARAKEEAFFLLHAIPAYTGMRRGEVLRLGWGDVDFNDDYVYARSRKQSQSKREVTRRVDLHPELKAILLDWYQKRPMGQYVICDGETLQPFTPDRANTGFWQPMRGTEWCLDSSKNWFKVGFHTHRHSFASNLAAAGVDQRVIDEFMGHQTEAMRRRYRHLTPRNRRSAIESFSLAVPGHPTD